MNAAVWLGSAVFFVFGVQATASSRHMVELIGTNNFPYFSVAIEQIIAGRFLYIYLVCAALAVVHLGAEWLYLGKYPHRLWVGLVASLCLLGAMQAGVVLPSLRKSHQVQFRQRVTTQERESAVKAFRTWQAVGTGLHYAMLLGLGVYLWRIGNPSEPMKFLSARQFRC
jgi:hypothetical protein